MIQYNLKKKVNFFYAKWKLTQGSNDSTRRKNLILYN